MALDPHSSPAEAGTPPEYARDHPRERANEWGWHAEWGGAARWGGWVVVAILLLMTTATNYQLEYHLVLWIAAAGLAGILLLDRRRRRHSWRER